jgi:hypothetical protein
VVTTAEHEETRASEAEAGLKHGTVVLARLVRPWHEKGDRIVCADSYFVSVEAALHLRARGVRFIGVVKTAPLFGLSARTCGCRVESRRPREVSAPCQKEGQIHVILEWTLSAVT